MAIVLRRHGNGKVGLVAICDVCGDMATGQSANLLWLPPDDEKTGDTYSFLIACRESCTRAADKAKGKHLYSQPLDAAIGFLLENASINLKDMRRTMKVLKQVG